MGIRSFSLYIIACCKQIVLIPLPELEKIRIFNFRVLLTSTSKSKFKADDSIYNYFQSKLEFPLLMSLQDEIHPQK